MNDGPIPAERTRRRPRFTLGVMMLLVAALGGWLGWIVHRARVQRQAVAAILRAGGNVLYDYEIPVLATKPRGPDWLRGLIGRDYFDTVYGINANKPAVDDAVVAQIGRLTDVRFLGLQGSTVTDAGLAGLAGMHDLRTLHFRSANVDGSGFRHLSGLHQLTNLHLQGSPITDENLTYLMPLTGIERLSFFGTRVTDAGMKRVARLPRLKHLTLGVSDIGDAGLREFGRIGRPIQIAVWPKTRITAQGIEAMKTLHPEITFVP